MPEGWSRDCVRQLAKPIHSFSKQCEILEMNRTCTPVLDRSPQNTRKDKNEACISEWTLSLVDNLSLSNLLALDTTESSYDNDNTALLRDLLI